MSNNEILVEDTHLNDSDIREVSDWFGLKEREERLENHKAIVEILEWAMEKTGNKDVIDALLHIRGVERGLVGSGTEPRITKLRRFIALEKDKERIEKELELLHEPTSD